MGITPALLAEGTSSAQTWTGPRKPELRALTQGGPQLPQMFPQLPHPSRHPDMDEFTVPGLGPHKDPHEPLLGLPRQQEGSRSAGTRCPLGPPRDTHPQADSGFCSHLPCGLGCTPSSFPWIASPLPCFPSRASSVPPGRPLHPTPWCSSAPPPSTTPLCLRRQPALPQVSPKGSRLWPCHGAGQGDRVRIPALPLYGRCDFGKWLKCSVPQFPHVQNGGDATSTPWSWCEFTVIITHTSQSFTAFKTGGCLGDLPGVSPAAVSDFL